MERNKRRKRILPFQSFRFLAILLIFMHHVNFVRDDGTSLLPGGGPLGVEFFIMLSGFVMTYAYWQRELPQDLYSKLKWTVGRIKKFYPLHLVTFLMAAPLTMAVAWKHGELLSAAGIAFLNLSLVQSWIPVPGVYFSYNAVSWYLSDTAFFYISLPVCLWLLHKLRTMKQAMEMLGGIYALQVTWNFICSNSEHTHWLIYINPIYRCTDFILGGCICVMTMHFIRRGGTWLHKGNATFAEFGAVTLLLLSLAVYPYVPENWSYQLFFSPTCAVLLAVFCFQRGWLSEQIFSNKMLVHLGEISLEIFLVHQLLLSYLSLLTRKIGLENGAYGWAYMVSCLMVVLGVSEGLYRYRKNRR